MHSGLYIVVLRNEEPISVNRGDARIESRCIRVAQDHRKFGKTSDFGRRGIAYARDAFERAEIRFTVIGTLSSSGSRQGPPPDDPPPAGARQWPSSPP